ncbi:MAG: EAL domain-containing protein [Devosia sp.]
MTIAQRTAIFSIFGVAMALFWFAPNWFKLDETGLMGRAAIAQIGGPLLGAILCWVASRRSADSARRAWRNFTIGCALYLAGNLGYLVFGLSGYAPAFPSVPEAAYFLMAGFFAAGMLQLSQLRNRVGPIQFYNFGLIYAAVALSSLFILHPAISSSVLQPFATTVAFLYPALWFSVAAFGAVSLVIYVHGNKSFAFALLVLAVSAEAAADFRYALSLLDGTYQMGGLTQLLWVISAGLIVWSAIEQIAAARQIADATPQVQILSRRADRGIAQATVPAVAVGAILLAAAFSGVLGEGPYAVLAAFLAVAFALVAGFREHWIISTQRRLRRDVERSREDLASSRRQIVAVLESTHDSVLVLDRLWNVIYFNRHAAETINQRDKLRIGISVWELFPAAMTSGEGAHYFRAIETGKPEEFDIFVEDRQLWLGIKAYPTEEGLSLFFRDISEQKRARDEIEHLALHDPLTGLANRTLFQKRLAEAEATGSATAVLLLDLDHFKEVNDTLGHPVGDALLVGTANRLRDCLGADVTIGRLGGDEFAAIVTSHDGENELAMIAMRLIETANAPHVITGHSVRVGASIGIAVSSIEEGRRDLFKDADIALYAAKTEARGAFRFFEPSMQIELLQKQALRSDLANALERNEFKLVFQPLVDMHNGRVAGFETLLRWHHPKRGPVSPDQFIPVAEESGQIVAIGEWVLRQACREAASWPEHISVAVNLSARQFSTDDLVGMVSSVLEETGLPASRLELEITETVLMRDSNANMVMLRALRDLGIRIALDDFGTGFSSLGYLQRFPFSKIKIDRQFISGLPGSEESQAIVRSIVGLGQSLGMRVTAEGVETQEQLDWVRAGCDEVQGYFLGRPVPASDVFPTIARIDMPQDNRRVG